MREPSLLRRRALALTVGLVLVVPLAACSDDDDDGGTATTAASSGDSALPPIISDLSSIDGTTVAVPEGGTVDLTGDTETYTDWTADIADPAIVSFVAGRDEGGAQFNPGLQALAVGSTEVTLSNTTSGETRTFTVEVTAP